MSVSIKSFDSAASADDIVAEIRKNGVVAVENVFSSDAIDTLKGIIDVELDKQESEAGAEYFPGKRSISALFARGAEFSETLLLNERVLEVMDRVLLPERTMASSAPPKPEVDYTTEVPRSLVDQSYPDQRVGPNCHHYRVNASVAMQVSSGGENQPLHRDEYRYLPYLRRDPAGPELSLAVMVPVTDFTIENGATRFIPGSNRWPNDRFPTEDDEVVQAVMPKGSAAFWLGSVFHGYGTSVVDEPRTGIIYSYAVDYLAQEENQFIAVRPEIARELPLKVRQLLGYRSSLAVNWVEGLDRNDLLAEGKSSMF